MLIIKDFKGDCKGIRLTQRGSKDMHIAIQILTEDDGDWFVSAERFSSAWIEDLQEQLQLAKKIYRNSITRYGNSRLAEKYPIWLEI